MDVVSVVCCQVEVSATSRSHVHRSPIECGALLCVIYKPRQRGGPGPLGAVAPDKQTNKNTQTNLKTKQIPNSHLLSPDPEQIGTAILQHSENSLPNDTV